ncbi:hypothetical protein EVAR_72144_1 [Eumeta japonica]|uniref:Uncharacterized protein n=1 Tax=Eumeta variegata TaxID=151549 RepID=A0A4C1SE24_EUMVA|nr:hypothetical protein EVAR_72144_1 [Eumeta japonica]
MQQREAEEMRNWNNTEYVVMPIDKLPIDESDQPINFSLKCQDNSEIMDSFSQPSGSQQLQEKERPQGG